MSIPERVERSLPLVRPSDHIKDDSNRIDKTLFKLSLIIYVFLETELLW